MALPRTLALVFVCALALAALTAFGSRTPARAASGASRPHVLAITLDSEIDPVSEEWVKRSITTAEHAHDQALVIEMDTPGGDETSMKSIIQAILAAQHLPIIVYVSPQGGRAASAGTFITYASDYAAMAPQTNIGAATPIDSSGSNIGSDLRRKVINDAVALITGLAQSHHRSVQFAQDAVRKADSLTSTLAVQRHVVEYQGASLADVLNHANGFVTSPKGLTLHTRDARVTHMSEPWTLRVFDVIIDPNILFLLFAIGAFGLIFEVLHPGLVAPGVIGAICLICALLGMQVLPIASTGVALIVLAFVLFGIETHLPTHGVLGVGGAISLVLGGSLLFHANSGYAVSWVELIVVAVALFSLFFFVVSKVMSARRAPVTTNAEGMVGRAVTVRRALTPRGQVGYGPEVWTAELTPDAAVDTVPVGSTVVIDSLDGFVLRVRPSTHENHQ